MRYTAESVWGGRQREGSKKDEGERDKSEGVRQQFSVCLCVWKRHGSSPVERLTAGTRETSVHTWLGGHGDTGLLSHTFRVGVSTATVCGVSVLIPWCSSFLQLLLLSAGFKDDGHPITGTEAQPAESEISLRDTNIKDRSSVVFADSGLERG